MLKIVVWDPTGSQPVGKHIDGAQQAAVLEKEHGAVLLPIDSDLGTNNAVGGYFRKDWGQGWPFLAMKAERGCPMLMYTLPDRPFIHWAMRVIPANGSKDVRGILRLTTNPAQLGGQKTAGLTQLIDPVDLSTLGEPDKHGGWTIIGKCRLASNDQGFVGFNVYGTAQDALVVWSAVSQSKQG